MSIEFEELDYRETPLGPLSLRRRSEPMARGKIVYEVRLGDEFLMSSLFTEGEVQLAKLALADLHGSKLDVVVGGLGLGYTAAAALDNPSVRSLTVVELMDAVIDWHRDGLVPLGNKILRDPRSRILQADFFSLATSPGRGFRDSGSARSVHAVLLDIDHSPRHLLDSENRHFYTRPALRTLVEKLHPGGVFGMWSNEPPDGDFVGLLGSVFESAESHVVKFSNPYTGGESSSTVYVARTSRPGP